MKKITVSLLLLSVVQVPMLAGTVAADEYAAAISVFQSSPEVQPFFKTAMLTRFIPPWARPPSWWAAPLAKGAFTVTAR
jgi:hypothetical protein